MGKHKATPRRARFGRRRRLRQLCAVILVTSTIWLLSERARGLDFGAIWLGVQNIALGDWSAAIVLTGISFWAVGRYDAIVHKMLGSSLSAKEARWGGRVAIAIGQTVGFGLITGAFLRWQWGRGKVSAVRSAKVTALVGLCFLGCGGIWTLLFLPLTSLPFAMLGPVAALGLGAALCWASIRGSAHRPGPYPKQWPDLQRDRAPNRAPKRGLKHWLKHRPERNPGPGPGPNQRAGFGVPPIVTLIRLMGLTAVDLGGAALAFWVLLPNPDLVSPATLFVVYAVALFVALLSNSPGGIGPFDVALLVLLPMVPDVEILATCIAFRIVYFALPASLASGALLVHLLREPNLAQSSWPEPKDRIIDLSAARNAELRLAEDPGKYIASFGSTTMACAALSQCNVALFDPQGPVAPGLRGLSAQARAADKFAALYKCTARPAVVARALGWATLRIAEDAIIDPQRFDPARPACRQLRRKLRKASAAGIRITYVTGALPQEQIADVDAAWTARHGRARGFSMSRPGHADLTAQQVFAIWQGRRLVGYCSFHQTKTAWALDLMPQHPDAPDGAMHMAITKALAVAKSHGIARVSLTAVPTRIALSHRLGARALQIFAAKLDNPGLRQFKASFDPKWEPLYLAAPTPLALCVAGLELCYVVANPPPQNHNNRLSEIHDLHDDYAFAS